MQLIERATACITVALLCMALLILGYTFDWTGFSGVIDAGGILKPPKLLWDWLDLLLVPIFLSFSVYFLEDSRRKSEFARELENQRQTIIDNFFEQAIVILTTEAVDPTCLNEMKQKLLRTLVLSAVRQLDGKRKGLVLQFLYETSLILKRAEEDPIVDLNGADLSNAVLAGGNLAECDLRGVNFENANFTNSNLLNADIRGSKFTNSDMTGVNLTGAQTHQCDFNGVKFN